MYNKPLPIFGVYHVVPCHKRCILGISAVCQAADIFSVPLSLHLTLLISHPDTEQLELSVFFYYLIRKNNKDYFYNKFVSSSNKLREHKKYQLS